MGGTFIPWLSQSCLVLAAFFYQFRVLKKKNAWDGFVREILKASLKNTFSDLDRSLPYFIFSLSSLTVSGDSSFLFAIVLISQFGYYSMN